jgi:hypothetical protein
MALYEQDAQRTRRFSTYRPPFDAWLVFDYDNGAAQCLSDHALFSSRVPAPRHWFIFYDRRSTQKCAADLQSIHTNHRMGRTSELAFATYIQPASWTQLLKRTMDLAWITAVPLPMQVIAE